jgi:hypothetical protein
MSMIWVFRRSSVFIFSVPLRDFWLEVEMVMSVTKMSSSNVVQLYEVLLTTYSVLRVQRTVVL